MLLRTYPLIAHPAFLRFIEREDRQLSLFDALPPEDVPASFPRIRTPGDLANYLGVRPLTIRNLARKKDRHYRVFDVRKRSGGIRTICAPRTFLKVAQWWVLDNILELESELPFVFGFTRSKSFIDNARYHHGSKYVRNVDIKDFFPTIRAASVKGLFLNWGYSDPSSDFLTELVTYEGALPQGAPTSPKISNHIFRQCDIDLRNLAQKNGMLYSRYADDMTFSGSSRIAEEFLLVVRERLSKDLFYLNDSKNKFMGVNQRKEVTGLILARDDIALPPEFLNRLRGWFHGISNNPQLRGNEIHRVRGSINLLEQVGGRGVPKVLDLGRKALIALTVAGPVKLEWGKD